MYLATTNNITVSVESIYSHELSSPFQYYFVWHYNIEIKNRSDDTVKLLSRHWQIINSEGKIKEVRGEGVVGKQPILVPGEKFHYTSSTDLGTSTGIMKGTYTMLSTNNGREFNIIIPAFSLDKPGNIEVLN